MILHTVNKSPQQDTLKSCLKIAAPDCAILLIEDGVYAAIADAKQTPEALFQHQVYALEADIKARGLTDKIDPRIEQVDYQGFVALTEKYDCVQSWY